MSWAIGPPSFEAGGRYAVRAQAQLDGREAAQGVEGHRGRQGAARTADQSPPLSFNSNNGIRWGSGPASVSSRRTFSPLSLSKKA